MYENPDNTIKINNLNLTCGSIKIIFSKPIQISNIIFLGNEVTSENNTSIQNLNKYSHIISSFR